MWYHGMCALTGLLDLLLLLLHGLLLSTAAASPSSTTAASAAARDGADDHLRDLVGGQEVGEDDGVERGDVGVARRLEEGVDLLGGDVGLQ